MACYALASELDRLTPEQLAQVDHIIIDDGEWTAAQIAAHINRWSLLSPDPLPDPFPDDWAKPEPLA